MGEFNYKKWVTNHKHSNLLEQTGPASQTCYACAYEASDIADGSPYTPAATIEIQFNAASIGNTGQCVPTGMGNAYMFSELSSQLAANGITPANVSPQGNYDMLSSYHGIPLQGHWSTDINQTGCPSLQIGPTTGPSTGSGIAYDPDFEDTYDDDPGPLTQDFPAGFDPEAWADSWFDNFLNFVDTTNQVPFQTPPNACSFIEGRIQLWTSQYQTAGPLYQNQLLFKIQVAYIAQDYFECSGAPVNNYTGIFVNEQIDRNKIPSKFKAMADKALKAFDRKLKAKAKAAAKRRPEPAATKPEPAEKGRIKESLKMKKLKTLIKEALSEQSSMPNPNATAFDIPFDFGDFIEPEGAYSNYGITGGDLQQDADELPTTSSGAVGGGFGGPILGASTYYTFINAVNNIVSTHPKPCKAISNRIAAIISNSAGNRGPRRTNQVNEKIRIFKKKAQEIGCTDANNSLSGNFDGNLGTVHVVYAPPTGNPADLVSENININNNDMNLNSVKQIIRESIQDLQEQQFNPQKFEQKFKATVAKFNKKEKAEKFMNDREKIFNKKLEKAGPKFAKQLKVKLKVLKKVRSAYKGPQES